MTFDDEGKKLEICIAHSQGGREISLLASDLQNERKGASMLGFRTCYLDLTFEEAFSLSGF